MIYRTLYRYIKSVWSSLGQIAESTYWLTTSDQKKSDKWEMMFHLGVYFYSCRSGRTPYGVGKSSGYYSRIVCEWKSSAERKNYISLTAAKRRRWAWIMWNGKQVSSETESLPLFSQVTISVKNGSTVVPRREKSLQSQVNQLSDDEGNLQRITY